MELVNDILSKCSEVTGGCTVGQGYANSRKLQHKEERSLSQLREDSVGTPDTLVTTYLSHIRSVVEETTHWVKGKQKAEFSLQNYVKMLVMVAHACNPCVRELEAVGFLGLTSQLA